MAVIPVITRGGQTSTRTPVASTSSRVIPVITRSTTQKSTLKATSQNTRSKGFTNILDWNRERDKVIDSQPPRVIYENLQKAAGDVGRFLQRTPNLDLGSRGQKTFKATDTETKIINFISNVPSAFIRGKGDVLEQLSTKQGRDKAKKDAANLPKTISQVKTHIERREWQKAYDVAMTNSAFVIALETSDFIPAGLLAKLGIKGVKAGTTSSRTLLKKTVKEGLEEAEGKIVKEVATKSTGHADAYVKKFGNVVDSDRAKELLPGYTPDKAPEFHKASQKVRDEVYTKLLAENKGKGDNTVYFTAGGAASGKSESIGKITKDAITYDTTLSSPGRLADLKRAIDNGYNVHVDYTASDPIAAWDRVQKRGRQIPLESFARDYEQALDNIKKLYTEYKDDPRVTFGFIDNTGEMGKAKAVTFDEISKLDYNKDRILKEINEKQTISKQQTRTSEQENATGGRKYEPGNEAQVSPKEVNVPRQQLPVGKGEEKVSRLEERITKSLDKAPEDVKNLSTFQQMNKKEQIAQASKYVSENPDEALAVLRGEKEAPKGLLNNSIYVAMQNLAEGDVALARRLASLSSTRAGQEISILSEIDPNSPVKLMRDVVKVREEAFKKRYGGKSAQEVSKKVVNEIKKKVKAPDKYDWSKFVDSIQC